MIEVTLKTRTALATPKTLADGYISQNWWPELRLDLDLQGIAADFYLFYAMKDGDEYLQARFEEYAQVVAKQVAVYLDAAVGGELRYKGFAGLTKGTTRSIARRDWRVRRLTQGHSLLTRGRDNFLQAKWKGGYGGPRWGNIAKLLVQHLASNLSPTLFVDQALALQHNGGQVFNKIDSYWNQGSLQAVLNANLEEDWPTLLEYASPWAVVLFTSWLGAQDELRVEGIEISRPIRPEYSEGEFHVGSWVRISSKARNKALAGKTTQVVAMRPPEVGKSTCAVQVMIQGHAQWLSSASLEVHGSNSTAGPFEYISRKGE